MSRNDIVLLAWGSRSISSVRRPRRARAAARLMAVVVFPTPPFWLAMATITGGPGAAVWGGVYADGPPRPKRTAGARAPAGRVATFCTCRGRRDRGFRAICGGDLRPP